MSIGATPGSWVWAGRTAGVAAHSDRKRSINLPNPWGGITFERWAGLLREQWAQYNVPSPVGEGLWHVWAEQLLALPPVVSAGVVDPRMFSDWREWAVTLMQVPN